MAAWLPPPAFLPPGLAAPVPTSWSHWDSPRGIKHRPRGFASRANAAAAGSWDAQAALDDLAAATAARRVYASVDALADAMQAQLAVLAG